MIQNTTASASLHSAPSTTNPSAPLLHPAPARTGDKSLNRNVSMGSDSEDALSSRPDARGSQGGLNDRLAGARAICTYAEQVFNQERQELQNRSDGQRPTYAPSCQILYAARDVLHRLEAAEQPEPEITLPTATLEAALTPLFSFKVLLNGLEQPVSAPDVAEVLGALLHNAASITGSPACALDTLEGCLHAPSSCGGN